MTATTYIADWFDAALAEYHSLHHEPSRATPLRIGVEVTNACNLNCVMCNTKLAKRRAGLIDVSLFETIVDEVAAAGVGSVELYTVGEPFLHPKLDRLVAIAYDHGLNVYLSTNAQFPLRVQSLYERFEAPAPYLFLSIDGATKETYERIRRGARFERALETLEVVHALNQKRATRIPASIRSILSSSNIGEISLFFRRYAKYFGPRDINFQLINGISPDTSYFIEAIPFEHLVHRKVPCHMPFRNAYFTFDGKVTLCARDYDGDLIVGDVRAESFTKIWNGQNAEAVREKHRRPETMDIPACLSCLDTYRLARTISNEYIHHHVACRPTAPSDELAADLTDLLKGVDAALGNHDVDGLRVFVQTAFDEINRLGVGGAL
ncbi:MAG: radical SAM protein [Candidatus Rokubacteria bacterium]|nr:radical SAM protein [Candidatus Rokubacteria bacterium]